MCCSTLKYVCCYGDGDHRTLHVLTHSFPTRRSSDLTKKPSMYKVLMLNDDYTPMELVVHVLEQFFGKNREEATRIMLHVHPRAVGVFRVFTYDVAEHTVTQVISYAGQHLQQGKQAVWERAWVRGGIERVDASCRK